MGTMGETITQLSLMLFEMSLHVPTMLSYGMERIKTSLSFDMDMLSLPDIVPFSWSASTPLTLFTLSSAAFSAFCLSLDPIKTSWLRHHLWAKPSPMPPVPPIIPIFILIVSINLLGFKYIYAQTGKGALHQSNRLR